MIGLLTGNNIHRKGNLTEFEKSYFLYLICILGLFLSIIEDI